MTYDTPLTNIPLANNVVHWLRKTNIRTLEQLLSRMLSSEESLKKCFVSLGADYDTIKGNIYTTLPPECIKQIEKDHVRAQQSPKRGMGYRLRDHGVPLDKITISEPFKEYLQAKGYRTLERVLGAMLVVPEAFEPLCKQYGTTYDALKKQICAALPPETVKRLEDDSANPPHYGMGALPER